MNIKSAVFHLSARNLAAAPTWDYKEFALIGRSNVGKSSLVNMLTNKQSLAKVSATPGKTQLLNFFIINQAWSLVDLPGYGYAKTPERERIGFNESVADYLANRDNLQRVFVLIDSRLSPQRIDLDFIEWLGDCGVPFTLVFTKADKLSAAKARETMDAFLTAMPKHLEGTAAVILSSSKTRTGRNEILRAIHQAMTE